MDIRIASEDARFGFVFSQRGIVPEAASSWFLPRIVGISQALEWCYSGRVFPAQEALAGRLVSKVVPPDELLPTARAIAKEIADKTAPVSVALIRQMMWRMLGADDPMEAHKVDSRGIYARGRSADVKEGVASFLEKRPAQFTDKVSNDMPDVFPVVGGARLRVSERPAPADATQDGVVLLHGISRTARSFRKMQLALEARRFRHAQSWTTPAAARRWRGWRRIFIPPSSALPAASTAPSISSVIPWAGSWRASTSPAIGRNGWAAW